MGRRTSDEVWQERFKLWQQSGLSQRVWCAENGVSFKSFSNARSRRLLGRSESRPEAIDTPSVALAPEAGKIGPFIQLHLSDSPSEGEASRGTPALLDSGVAIVIGELRVELARDFDALTLQRVLAAVGKPQ